MKFRGLAVLVMMLAATMARASEGPIRMFVYADSGGFSDDKSESARDLAETFRHANDPKAAKDLIVLVDEQAAADVVVEIIGRDLPETGTRTYSFGQSHAQRMHQVAAKLSVGPYSTEIDGRSTIIVKPWRDAASHLHDNIEKFVKKNRAKF